MSIKHILSTQPAQPHYPHPYSLHISPVTPHPNIRPDRQSERMEEREKTSTIAHFVPAGACVAGTPIVIMCHSKV